LNAIAEVTYNSPEGSIPTGLWVKITKLDSGFRVEELNKSRRGYVDVFTIPGENAVFVTPKLNGHADASYVVEKSSCYVLNPVKRGSRIVIGAYNSSSLLPHGYALFPIIYAGAMDKACILESRLQLLLNEPIFKGASTGAGWSSSWGYIPVLWLQPPDKVLVDDVELRLTPPFTVIPVDSSNITVVNISEAKNISASRFSAEETARLEIRVGAARSGGLFAKKNAAYSLYSSRMDAGMDSRWKSNGVEGVLQMRNGYVTQHTPTPLPSTVVVTLPDGGQAVVAKASGTEIETPFNILQNFKIYVENATHRIARLSYGGFSVSVMYRYVEGVGYFLFGASKYSFLEVLLYPEDAPPSWVAKNAEKINDVQNILGLTVAEDLLQYAIVIAPWQSTLIMSPWVSVPLSTLSPSEIPAVPAPVEEEEAAPVAPPKPCNDLLLLLITLTIMMLITSSYMYGSSRMRLTPHVAVAFASVPAQIMASVLLACSFTTLASTVMATVTTSLTTTYMLTRKLREEELYIEY
jgi:hypothetical protein